MLTRLVIMAQDILPNDLVKTSQGFIENGGVVNLSDERIGIVTLNGMLGIDKTDAVTVMREEQSS